MRTSVDAEQLPHVRRCRRAARSASPSWTTRPLSSTTTSLGEPLHDAEVLLDEEHGRERGDALERVRDLGHEQR